MHIPDGFLSWQTELVTGLASVGMLGVSARKTGKILEDRQVPVMGVMAAFIFAAQMVNFPVAPGASGHLLGAALATVLLGPWSASLILGTVLIIQCLFFQDGGLAALGGNIFNMAVLGPLVALVVYKGISMVFKNRTGHSAAIFAAGWCSVMVAAAAASIELAISGTTSLAVVLPPMLGWHALIGIGEGIITVMVVSFVRARGITGIEG